MKLTLILVLTISSILLLACTDSKESNGVNSGETILTTSRAVAQEYQISDTIEEPVKCLIDIAKGQGNVINLTKGQSVFLATEKTTTINVNGVNWLLVFPNDRKLQACYVQTLYLEPVANY